jgi:chromosome segregation ATPase
MTFYGRILVIVIMAVSLIFLGISTVVFTTSKNWLTATKDVQKKVDDLKKKIQESQGIAETAKKVLEDAKTALATETKNLNARLAALAEDNNRDLDQITKVRGQLALAQQTAKSTLQEVEAKRVQIDGLHQQKSLVEKRANEFKQHVTELNDRIRELERILETAAKNKSDLHKPAGRFSAFLRTSGS